MSTLAEWAPAVLDFASDWGPIAFLVLLTVLLLYGFLQSNHERFLNLKRAGDQQVAEERATGDQRVEEARNDERRRANEAIKLKQRQLADWTMERDATMSRVTGDWSARATELEMQLATRNGVTSRNGKNRTLSTAPQKLLMG